MRTYTCQGQELPSVTSILRMTWPAPRLQAWRERQIAEAAQTWRKDLSREERITWLLGAPDRVGGQSSSRGSMVHKYAEAISSGERPPAVTDEMLPYCGAWDLFFRDYKPRLVMIEHQVARPGSHAGTLDWIAETDDGLVLGDYKTTEHGKRDGGGRVYADMAAQLGGYSLCTLARPDKTVEWRPRAEMANCSSGLVVKLCGDGQYAAHRVNLERARELWELAYELWQALEDREVWA